jgi:hypothetical protein
MGMRRPRLILTAVAIAACASPARDVLLLPTEPPSTVSLGSDFTLAPGESVVINHGAAVVTFARVTSDSRCPTDALVQCVWAGSVQLALRVTVGSATQDVAIETQATRDTAEVGGFVMQLMAVTPERRTLDSIPVGQYRGMFRVRRR